MSDTPLKPVPEYALHDLCRIIPPHSEKEAKELKEDIRTNKLQVPVMIFENKVLDGRGRYSACVELAKEGVETGFKSVPFTGTPEEARKFVISTNVKRRHLNESQRALIAAELATFTHGGDRSKASIDALTQKQAAELLKVSEPTVERAVSVLKNSPAKLTDAIRQGKLTVSAVKKFTASDKQDKLISECKGDVVKAVKKLGSDKDQIDELWKRLKKKLEEMKEGSASKAAEKANIIRGALMVFLEELKTT